MKIEGEATLATAIEEINQKLEKVQEINDMRSQAFYKELNDVKKCLIMLYDKLY